MSLGYEVELTWIPTASCFGWSYVTYRVEDDDRDVVARGGSYSTREYAIEQAREAAEQDRSVRMFHPHTGKSFNIYLGTNPGTKRREIVKLS